MQIAQRLGFVLALSLAASGAFAQQNSVVSHPGVAGAESAPPLFDAGLLESPNIRSAKPADQKPAKAGVPPTSVSSNSQATSTKSAGLETSNTPSRAKTPSSSAHPSGSAVLGTPIASTTVTITVPADAALVPIAPLPTELGSGMDGVVAAFDIIEGDTLHSTLTRWSHAAGWTLIWQAKTDYAIEARMSFRVGTSYLEAVKQVMGSFWDRTQTLTAVAYKNNVLVVSGRGAQ
jgi:hypothetical protein